MSENESPPAAEAIVVVAQTQGEAVAKPSARSRREIFPNVNVEEDAHESVMEAMQAAGMSIASVKEAIRGRKDWLYKMTDEEPEAVVAFFGKPEGTPTHVGHSTIGKRLVAVWNGPGEVGDSEPYYD